MLFIYVKNNWVSFLSVLKLAAKCENESWETSLSVMAASLLPLMLILGTVVLTGGMAGLALAIILPIILRPFMIEFSLKVSEGCA